MDREDWPEWCVRQRVPGGRACVWVLAPDAAAAVIIVNRIVGRLGGWRTGPDVDMEVFPRTDYREHCKPEDFTRMVIGRPVRQDWLDRQRQLAAASGRETDTRTAP